MNKPLLSKSKYLYGIQCPKLLWMAVHEPEKFPEIDEITQHRFDEGHLVGEMAKKVFPDGIDIEAKDFNDNLIKTKQLLPKRKILFEAAIKNETIYARADILFPVNQKQWDVIEVKSSTQPKELHIHDLAFQKYCYEQAGLNINKCHLMHINGDYVRQGEINPKELFLIQDVDELVNESSKDMKDKIKAMLDIVSAEKIPGGKICDECKGPGSCPLPDECWSFLPENNVFNLYRGGKKGLELFQSGVYSIKDIPVSFNLSANQVIQKRCEQTGKPYIDKKGIKGFMDSLEFPLYFLDFETYNTAIPLYDGLSPYQQIPFLFSLHISDSIDSEPKHHSFLAEGDKDPRLDFLSALKEVIGKKGSIIVYNQSFEKRIMNELGRAFPKNEGWINSLNNQFVDLLAPFQKFYYYDSKQQGSASLKKVLPALTGRDYVDLEIASGDSASLQYLYITHGATDGTKPTEKEILEIRRNLEKYCSLDTEGMVEILRVLSKLA